MNKLTYLLLCLVLGIGLATAQTRKVTGTVISAEDSEPIIGASVIVKGTTTGTVTDFDGVFSLDVPSSAKTLVISYVGMIAREVPVQDVLRVVLQSGTQNLEEVVVTAIGMKKQEKALGYAASTVKSEDLNAAKSGSVMSGLTGKVAGLNITSGGATGSSQKVIVRGISSFSANQPLYVVDGVPIMNDFQGEDSFSNSVDFGNQANDINPEDVESVTVLKGASATALYGSRAANGVIMVTTKRAGAERLSVTYDGSFMGSSVLRVPQTQDRFGQGWGSFGPMENGSWGPVLDGRDHIWGPYSDGSEGLLTPLSKPFSYVKNNLRDFYETGFETNNNVSIRMGNDKLGFVASYGNVKSDGVLPGDADSYARNTISLRGNMKYKRFSAELNLNYVRKDITQAAAGQGDDGATMFSEILQHAVDVDISSMKDYTNPYFNTDNFYTAYAENPYWVLDHNRNKYQDDRVYGKIELAFEIMKGLKAVGRLGGDFTNATQEFMSDTELIARLFPTEGIHACEEVGKVRLPVDMNKIASLHEVTLRMEHVKIRYGSRTILKDLDWEIKNGEKWALFGPNGAGKSTLLSLVYADNPQSYANTLYLFDRKRGSGESIWDIKKRIGYVSPEMHLYYKENVPTLNIVGSGFFDSIGLFRKCNAEQETVALEWMKVFGIEHLKDRLFLTLSSGEQRLALLARAFVKDPDLIILDEPLHGLDVSNKKKAAAIIEQFCDRPGKTLIYVTHYPHELPACVDKRFELVKHS